MAETPRSPTTSRGPGYEVRDTNVRAVVTFLVALTVFVPIVQVLLWFLLNTLSTEGPPSEPAALTVPPMIPEQLRALRSAENEVLGGKDGTSKIESAIDQIADRGLPVLASDRTEAEVSSHAGKPAPANEPPKAQEPRK